MKNNIAKTARYLAALAVFWGWAGLAQANIVVKSIIVNPSADQKKAVPYKAYLPKEVKPENILDSGGLEVAFDTKEGVYYVFGDFDLGPKEIANVEVELEDVWKIAAERIRLLREETESVAKRLMNTEYQERAVYLKNSVTTRLNQVDHVQAVGNPSPAGYISDYRDNLKIIESVEADLAAARALVATARAITPQLTWKIIMAIVLFLGLLGVAFFLVWQRQIRTLARLTEDFEGAIPAGLGTESRPEEGERREAEGEKKAGLSDIEDRLRDKP